jgi:hypothetical protein
MAPASVQVSVTFSRPCSICWMARLISPWSVHWLKCSSLALCGKIRLDPTNERPRRPCRNPAARPRIPGRLQQVHPPGVRIDPALTGEARRGLLGVAERGRSVKRRRVGDRPEAAHLDASAIGSLLRSIQRGLEARPAKKFSMCDGSNAAISGVVEVEKSSSDVVSASSEPPGAMLSRFSRVKPGCDNCSRYSPEILIGVNRSSTQS